MAMQVGTGGGAKCEINVTPLVDVVLVLLIIFMVITPLVQMGYDLQIPRKAESSPTDAPDPDQVVITVVQGIPNVKVYINKEEVQTDQLGKQLEGIYRGRRDKLMFLAADRRVNYSEVMKVVNIARTAGGEKLKIGLFTDDKLPISAEGSSGG